METEENERRKGEVEESGGDGKKGKKGGNEEEEEVEEKEEKEKEQRKEVFRCNQLNPSANTLLCTFKRVFMLIFTKLPIML